MQPQQQQPQQLPPQQQQTQHQQQEQASNSSTSGGLLQLEITEENALRSTEGHVIIQQLGPGVTVATGPQHPANLPVGSNLHNPAGLLLDLSSGTAASAEAVVRLGEVCGKAFMACARIKLCWMSSYHASSIAGLPGHIQFLLVELSEGGPYATILPLLPDGCKATLQPDK